MIAILLLLPVGVGAQTLAVSSQQAVPPVDLAPAVVAGMQTSGFKVTSGGTTLEFWWVQSLPVTAEGPGWDNTENGTLVGALRVTGVFKEIRGKTVKPGVYTLRYGLQPQNGDHLGISPFREYLLISPAGVDTDPKPAGFDGAVALSKQTIGTSHPASLSIDPPEATAEPLSAYTSELGHKGVVFEVPRSLNGKPVGSLRFGVIVVGLIVH